MDGIDHALVVGSRDFDTYLGPLKYAGAIVGRVANRIAGGRATLDGRVWQFDRNENGRTTLHGGSSGAGERNWTLREHDRVSCEMAVTLRDGQDGFPGNLAITARYALAEDGVLTVTLRAGTDAPTFCNLAHHSFWNLDGRPDHSHHILRIPADRYLALDQDNIPQGAPMDVVGSRFDFRHGRQIVRPDDAGIDHCLCFDDAQDLRPLCRLEAGGIQLQISSHEPGLQVYDGRHFNAAQIVGHEGQSVGRYAGVALEPQQWPNAPNRPDCPGVRLDPGETYQQTSTYRLVRL